MTQTKSSGPTSFRLAQRRSWLTIKTSTDVIAFTLSFIVSLVGLNNAVLGPIAAAVIFGLGLSSFLLFPNMLMSNPRAKWIIGLGGLSFISILWSVHPGSTFYYSTQLMLTILVGLTLASFPNPTPVLKGLFYAHLIFAILSLMFGQHVLWQDGQYVFVGLSRAKNNYGAMNFYVVLLGVYAMHQGLRERRGLFSALGALAILVGFAGLAYSRASGSFVSAVIGIILYLALAWLARLKLNSRLVLLLFGITVVGLLLLVLSAVRNELAGAVLGFFGKDATLTGRVLLWDIADRIIDQNFWLGVGHFAFWVQNDPLPEAIWAEMGIASRGGFNFHSSYREIMIHFGMTGLIFHTVILGYLALQLLRGAIFRPRLEAIVLTVMTFSTFTKIPFEAVLPLVPMSSGTIFLVTALALRPAKA